MSLYELLYGIITRVMPIRYGGTGATTLAGIFELLSIDISSTNTSGHATIGKIGIEWGIVYVTPSTASGSLFYGDGTVNFVYKYANIPSCSVSMRGGNYISTLYPSVIEETTSSCAVRVTASNQTERRIRYLVVGERA